MGRGVVRVQPDGLVVVLDGAVGLVLGDVAVPATVEGNRHLGRHIPRSLDDGRAAFNTLIGREGLLLVQTPRPVLAQVLRPGQVGERQHPEHDTKPVPHDISRLRRRTIVSAMAPEDSLSPSCDTAARHTVRFITQIRGERHPIAPWASTGRLRCQAATDTQLHRRSGGLLGMVAQATVSTGHVASYRKVTTGRPTTRCSRPNLIDRIFSKDLHPQRGEWRLGLHDNVHDRTTDLGGARRPMPRRGALAGA